jgi:outer membrane protein OmpA-like peptidoglycan-associated protein
LTLSSGTCSYSFVSGTTSYACNVTGLTPGNTVTGTLLATNNVGNSALATTNINYVTGVGAPTSVVATNGDGQVSLSFAINNGGDSIVSYDYSIDGLSYSPLNAISSPVTITGLTNDVAYNIYLRAKGATYGDGPSSSSVAVLPRLAMISIAQNSVTPSYLKPVAVPTITKSKSSYVCTRGEYQFVRSGKGSESAVLTEAFYKLYINGAVVDSATSSALEFSFNISELSQASTVSCSALISQDNVSNEFKSLDNLLNKDILKIRNDAFEVAAESYQASRYSAYADRIEGNAESISTWKKSIDAALVTRKAAEEIATSIYRQALEKAGISIYFAAPEVKKDSKPIDVKEPAKVNVQPTNTMRKVGTIYFANGTYYINDASRKAIKAIAAKFSKSNAKLVLSYGHTDKSGGVNNTLLSKNRARAVASLLNSALAGKKVLTGWYASTKPISTGVSKNDLALNRRVEIYVK